MEQPENGADPPASIFDCPPAQMSVPPPGFDASVSVIDPVAEGSTEFPLTIETVGCWVNGWPAAAPTGSTVKFGWSGAASAVDGKSAIVMMAAVAIAESRPRPRRR